MLRYIIHYYTYYLRIYLHYLFKKNLKILKSSDLRNFSFASEVAVPVEHLQFYYQKYYKKVEIGGWELGWELVEVSVADMEGLVRRVGVWLGLGWGRTR